MHACTSPYFYKNAIGALHQPDHPLPPLAAVPAAEVGALPPGEETVVAEEAVCFLVQLRSPGVHGREGGAHRAGGGQEGGEPGEARVVVVEDCRAAGVRGSLLVEHGARVAVRRSILVDCGEGCTGRLQLRPIFHGFQLHDHLLLPQLPYLAHKNGFLIKVTTRWMMHIYKERSAKQADKLAS
jgi:hypothetical protein